MIVTENGDILYNTQWKSPIPQKNKISFKRFMLICWENSQTNLHYKDFCRINEPSMKKMYKPVKIIES